MGPKHQQIEKLESDKDNKSVQTQTAHRLDCTNQNVG